MKPAKPLPASVPVPDKRRQGWRQGKGLGKRLPGATLKELLNSPYLRRVRAQERKRKRAEERRKVKNVTLTQRKDTP